MNLKIKKNWLKTSSSNAAMNQNMIHELKYNNSYCLPIKNFCDSTITYRNKNRIQFLVPPPFSPRPKFHYQVYVMNHSLPVLYVGYDNWSRWILRHLCRYFCIFCVHLYRNYRKLKDKYNQWVSFHVVGFFLLGRALKLRKF